MRPNRLTIAVSSAAFAGALLFANGSALAGQVGLRPNQAAYVRDTRLSGTRILQGIAWTTTDVVNLHVELSNAGFYSAPIIAFCNDGWQFTSSNPNQFGPGNSYSLSCASHNHLQFGAAGLSDADGI